MRVVDRAVMHLIIGLGSGIARPPILLTGAARHVRRILAGLARYVGGKLAHLIADRLADLLGGLLGRVGGRLNAVARLFGGLGSMTAGRGIKLGSGWSSHMPLMVGRQSAGRMERVGLSTCAYAECSVRLPPLAGPKIAVLLRPFSGGNGAAARDVRGSGETVVRVQQGLL